MMTAWLVGLLLVWGCLEGKTAPEEMALSAEDVTYEEHHLELTGHVVLDHAMGTLLAEQASLAKGDEERFGFFPYVRLMRNVQLNLKDGARLLCQQADLNFVEEKGQFSGDSTHPHVEFIDHQVSPQHGTIPIRLKGKCLKVQLFQHETRHRLTDLLALGEIELQYDQNFTIHADKASYRSVQQDQPNHSRLSGMITLMPAGRFGTCDFRYKGQVNLRAQQIAIDSEAKHLYLQEVDGQLKYLTKRHQQDTLTIQANTLNWDEAKRILVLRGDVSIASEEMGSVQTEKEVTIALGPRDEPLQIKQVQVQGTSRFLIHDQSRRSSPPNHEEPSHE